MLNRSFVFFLTCLLLACAAQKSKNPHVEIQTKFGNIELELYADQAPKSVAAFLSNIDAGYYRKASFYRVLNEDNQASDAPKAAFVQGGLWKSNYKLANSLPGIPHETTQQTKLSHTDGVVSFARREPGTAASEFFICVGDQRGLDYGGENNPDGQGYAAFGKVVTGMDVVKKIYNQPDNEQYFDPPVHIFKIARK